MATSQSSANTAFVLRKEVPTENASVGEQVGLKPGGASGKEVPKAPISKKAQISTTLAKWAGRSVRVGGYDSFRMKSQAVPRQCADPGGPVPKSPAIREEPEETLVDTVTAGFADLTTEPMSATEMIVLVEDIDEKDSEGEWSRFIMCTDYVDDIMTYMFELENKYQIKPNFLNGQVTSRMRAVLMDWLVDVHTQYHFVSDSLFLTGKILDRFLSVSRDVHRKNFQLVGITCFLLACKYEEVYPPPMKELIAFCDNAFTGKSVCEMEQKILVALQFDLASPGPALFLRRFSKAAKSDIRLHSLAKYIMELCLVDTSVADLIPSAVAAGSLAVSNILLKDAFKQGWNPTVEHYTKYPKDQLRPIASRIADVLYRAQSNKELKLQAVTKKYTKTKELCRIAKISELEPENLQRRFSTELGWQEKLSSHSVLSNTILKGGMSLLK